MCLACAIAKITDKFWAQLRGKRHYSSPVLLDAPTPQAKANFDKHAERICDPVTHSALWLKVGRMSSIMAPKAIAPIRTGSRPKRPVRASGRVRAAKAMKFTSLSLPSDAEGATSSGQSIATVRAVVTTTVRGISRYFRISSAYWCGTHDARLRIKIGYS